MFGKRRPIERYTDAELVIGLIVGSVICLLVVIPTFYIRLQPDWLLWIVRGYGGLWLLDWWRRHLGEMARRRG